MNPALTVLMPVYNCRPFVGEALRSVLSQSLSDYEVIVIDDASTDGTGDDVRGIGDPRISVLRNEVNLRVGGCLNRGLEQARGRYIVRMDGDDVCVPGRFAAQFSYMESHPDVGVCGGWVKYFGVGIPHVFRPPSVPEDVSAFMLFQNPFCHPAVMIRRSCLDEHQLRYDTAFTFSEDYDLWTRLEPHTRMANLPQVLLHLRQHPASVSRQFADTMTAQTGVILRRMLLRLKLEPNEDVLQFHFRLGRGCRLEHRTELDRAEKWLQDLIHLNDQEKTFHPGSFRRVVSDVWFRVCANSAPLGLGLWGRWKRSDLSRHTTPALDDRLRFVASLLWHGVRRREGTQA